MVARAGISTATINAMHSAAGVSTPAKVSMPERPAELAMFDLKRLPVAPTGDVAIPAALPGVKVKGAEIV